VGSETYGYMESNRPGRFLEPDVLRSLDKIQARMVDEVPAIVKVIGLPDLVKKANQVFHDNDPAYYKIPDSKKAVSQLLMLYEMESDGDIVSSLAVDDYTKSRVRIFAIPADSVKVTDWSIRTGKMIAKAELPKDITYEQSGRPAIMVNTLYYISDSQIVGISLALFIIALSISILFRSLKQGLFSLIPNILPIAFTMGVMGWLGIDLDVGTAMVSCVALGIVVDDTIHLMWTVKQEIDSGATYQNALQKAFELVGPAMITTTLVLCVGFMGLMVSQLWPTTYIGILMAVACMSALVCDLFLAPVLIMKLRPFDKRVRVPRYLDFDDVSEVSEISAVARP